MHCSTLQIQMQLKLQDVTQHYTKVINIHYATATTTTTTATTTTATTTLHCATLRYNYNYTTLHYAKLHYTTLITPHHNYNCNSNCSYTTLITLHYTTTPLRYTTATTTTALHHTTSSSCGEVTSATIATTLQPLQLSIFDRSLAGLLRFLCCQLENWGSLAELLCFWCCAP